MKGFKDIDLRLCHYCGTCVGVCPEGALVANNGIPHLEGRCVLCGLCFRSCPGIEFSYPEFNRYLFGTSKVDAELGYYRSIKAGYAVDKITRSKGASGGIVSALLIHLLNKGQIQAAVVVGMDAGRPYQSKVKIATTAEEILRAAQSKYTMIAVNEILRELPKVNGNIAFVGLPCHIQGIRKLQKIGSQAAEKIKYCIGIFCGSNMDQRATDFLIRKSGIGKDQVSSLEYRGGRWPGGFRLKSRSGREFFVAKHNYLYLNLMFSPQRCLLCPDLTNEFADISVGDAWNNISNIDRDRGSEGLSTIIVRTEKGEDILSRAFKQGDIFL